MKFKYQAKIYPPKKYMPKGVKKGSHIFFRAGVTYINTSDKSVVENIIARRVWVRELDAYFSIDSYSKRFGILYIEHRLSKLSRAIVQSLYDDGWFYNREIPKTYRLPSFDLQTKLPSILEPASP